MVDLTLLEASRALGTTKNAVKYHIKKLPEGMVYKSSDGKQYITPQGLELLRKIIEGTEETSEEPVKTDSKPMAETTKTDSEPSEESVLIRVLTETITALKGQLEVKDKQLAEKDKQLAIKSGEMAQLMKLLDQSQALQRAEQLAHTNPSIEAPESKKRRAGWFRRGKE